MAERDVDPAVVDQVRSAWTAGDPVVLPTDTVYGLVAPAGHEAAVARIFELKGRPIDRRMAVLVADVRQADGWIDVTEPLRRLVARFWPGALTIVGDRRAAAPPWVGDETTVAVRCPDDALLRDLAAEFGPLAATSANPHGSATSVDAAAVSAALPGVGLVVDGGPRVGEPSTVVALREDAVEVVREGRIPAAVISAVLQPRS